jgi:hypothetical protein
MKIVTACVENVGCSLKLILHGIFVPVTNEREMLNSQMKDRIRNTAIRMSFDDSFACPCSMHSFVPES